MYSDWIDVLCRNCVNSNPGICIAAVISTATMTRNLALVNPTDNGGTVVPL